MFSWTVLKKGSPKEKDRAAVVVRDKLYYFGSDENNEAQIGVQVFNTVSLEWRKLPPVPRGRGERPPEIPCSRTAHTAVLIGDIVYIWGGRQYHSYRYGSCNVLLAFNVDTHRWYKPSVSGTVPEGRKNHSACVLGKVMFIHGGWTYHSLNDVYKLDTTTMVWSVINTTRPPPDSACHTTTIIGTKMFVFQYFSTQYFRVFDTETNCWLNINASAQLLPEKRLFPSAFIYNGEQYIFGGLGSKQCLNDLWRFNPESFSWKKVEPKGKEPSPTYKMCCCMVGDRIFLFGGVKSDDLYILDLSPSLKTLCKLAVIQYSLEQSELPHNIRWELKAMTSNS